MLKTNFFILFFLSILFSSVCYADDGGSRPGYVYTPSSGSNPVKTAYDQCVHNAYWKPEYGMDICNDAPEQSNSEPAKHVKVETISFSDADVVLFDFNQVVLTTIAQQKLLAFVAKLKKSDDVTKITINGFTDAIGEPTYNKNLSNLRAEAIKKFFIDNGFNNATIAAIGMGSESTTVSSACFKQYGKDHLSEIEKLRNGLSKLKSPKVIEINKVKINQLISQRNSLINCTALDRKVVLVVEHTTTETVETYLTESGSIPSSGLISEATAIESSSSLDDE